MYEPIVSMWISPSFGFQSLRSRDQYVIALSPGLLPALPGLPAASPFLQDRTLPANPVPGVMNPVDQVNGLSLLIKALPARVFTVMITVSLLVALPSHVMSSEGGGSRCPSSPDEVQHQMNECLDVFQSFQESFRLTGSHLFTSVDVEIIRTLCSHLKSSMRCLRSLRDQCLSIRHRNQFDSTLRPYVAVIELCDHHSLHEEYAMIQNCLHSQRERSELCYGTFRSHIDRLKAPEHHHAQQFCRYLSDLVSCVRSNFASSCGDSSSFVVELLVKAAIDGSHRCRRTSAADDDSAITVSPQKTSHVVPQRRSRASQRLSEGTKQQTIIYAVLSMTHLYLRRIQIPSYLWSYRLPLSQQENAEFDVTLQMVVINGSNWLPV